MLDCFLFATMTVNTQNATQEIIISDFQNSESLHMHELLMKVAGMRSKCDFSAKVFALRSIGNELVPSPL